MPPLHIFDADYPRALLVDKAREGFPEGISLLQNWHFEDPVCWSRETSASLVVDRASFPVPTELMFEVSVFNASKDNPKTVTVESPGNGLRRFVFTSRDRRRLVVTTPWFQSDSSVGELVFHIDRLESPFEIGLAKDDRLLGLAIHTISQFESRPILPLDLCGVDDPRGKLVSGWSVPEPIGVWSDADAVEIRLAWRDLGHAIGVDLLFDTFARPDTVPPLELRVFCNDCETDQLSPTFTEGHRLRVIFAEADASWGHHRIRIEMTNLISPADLGMSTDGRRLGILLKRMEPVLPGAEAALLEEDTVS